jgi:hypothetical protein
MFGTVRTLLRGSLLLAGPAMASVLAFRLTSGLRRPPTPAYDELLVAGAAWALVIGTAWAVAVCAAAVLEVTSTGRWALTGRLGCPTSARRTLLAGLGVLLAGGGALAAAPVSAAPAPLERGASGPRSGFTLPVPARPTGATYSLPRQRV